MINLDEPVARCIVGILDNAAVPIRDLSKAIQGVIGVRCRRASSGNNNQRYGQACPGKRNDLT